MAQLGPFIVVAQIADAILPVARGAKYEDPLDAALKGAKFGAVSGGGSSLGPDRKVSSVDIELTLHDLRGALEFARINLLSLGAPAGSLLLFLRDGQPRAVAIATGQEFDHPPALEALGRRLVAPQVDEEEERARISATAAKILKDFEGLWAGRYEYPAADLSAYAADWLAWYDQVAEQLGALGLRFAGDIATLRTDLPAAKSLGFSRKFISSDGSTRADAFQVATAKPKPPVRVVVLKSEFAHGRLLGTSNAVLKWNVPSFIDDERLPAESSPEIITARHLERLTSHRATNSSAPLQLTSLAQLLAAEERERVRTRQFRQEQRIPAQVELERLGAAPEFAARVHEEMRRLKRL